MKIKMFVSIVILISGGVQADTNTVDLIVGGWSYHKDRDKGYNETHSTLGIKKNDYYILSYRNSNRDQSASLGKYIKHWRITENITLGGLASLTTGYGSNGPIPAYLPTVMISSDNFAADIIVIPNVVTYTQFRFKKIAEYDSRREFRPVEDRIDALSYSFGTLGSSLSYLGNINKHFDFRLEISKGRFEKSERLSVLDLRVDQWINTETFGAYLSYYPFKTKTLSQLSAEIGLVYNESSYNGSIKSSKTGISLQIEDIYKWKSVSQYIGIRFGRPWNKSLSGYVQIGAYSLKGGREKIDHVSDVLDVDMEKYQWYPVVQVGLTHTF